MCWGKRDGQGGLEDMDMSLNQWRTSSNGHDVCLTRKPTESTGTLVLFTSI